MIISSFNIVSRDGWSDSGLLAWCPFVLDKLQKIVHSFRSNHQNNLSSVQKLFVLPWNIAWWIESVLSWSMKESPMCAGSLLILELPLVISYKIMEHDPVEGVDLPIDSIVKLL